MALSLSIKSGSKVKVGDVEVRVVEIQGRHVLLAVQNKMVVVNDLERKEVLPQVFVSTSKHRNSDGRTRLVFEAPSEIRITRMEHAIQ